MYLVIYSEATRNNLIQHNIKGRNKMACKSLILILNSDESYSGISCAKDGQIDEGVGEMLYEYYDTPHKAQQLIDRGNAIRIRDDLASSDFCSKHKKKGEDDDDEQDFDMIELDDLDALEVAVENMNIKYVYVLEKDVWKFALVDGGCLDFSYLGDEF
jgi:hypothetical protein